MDSISGQQQQQHQSEQIQQQVEHQQASAMNETAPNRTDNRPDISIELVELPNEPPQTSAYHDLPRPSICSNKDSISILIQSLLKSEDIFKKSPMSSECDPSDYSNADDFENPSTATSTLGEQEEVTVDATLLSEPVKNGSCTQNGGCRSRNSVPYIMYDYSNRLLRITLLKKLLILLLLFGIMTSILYFLDCDMLHSKQSLYCAIIYSILATYIIFFETFRSWFFEWDPQFTFAKPA